MQSLALNQVFLFLIFLVTGVIIGVVFDLFRILRKTIKMSDIVIYIQDIIYCIFAGTIMMFSIFVFNKGEIRAFEFIAIFLGIVFYFLTISKHFVIIGNIVGNLIKKFVIVVLNIFLNILKKVVFKPITFISINIRHIFKFSSNNLFHIIPKKCKKKKDFNKKCSNI